MTRASADGSIATIGFLIIDARDFLRIDIIVVGLLVTALVGDPETIAGRIHEYRELAIDTVIASGFPHLEEAYRVAELLFPLLGGSLVNGFTLTGAGMPAGHKG